MRNLTVRGAAYGYICALLTVHWLFLPYGGYERMMEGKYGCFLLLTAGFFMSMLCLGRRTPLSAPRSAADAAAAAYLSASALSALCSPFGAQTLLGGTRRDGLLTLTLYVLIFWLLSRHLHPDRRLVYLTALSAALCDVLTMLQMQGWNPFWLYPAGLNYYDGDAAYAGFYAGTSGNIDFTAFLLAMAVCVLTAAMLRLRLWGLAPTVALTLWVLYRLGVAAAWAGIACAAVWGLALLVPKRRMLLVSLMLTVAALVFVRFYAGGNQTLLEASLLMRGQADGSFGSGRLAIWRECLRLARERPLLGGGPDTLWLRGLEPFSWVYGGTVIPSDITAAHNEYLNILVNQGVIAAAAYAVLLTSALLHCFRRAAEPRCALCGVGLLCYAAMAFFSISTCITTPFVWLLLALCNSRENPEKTLLKNGREYLIIQQLEYGKKRKRGDNMTMDDIRKITELENKGRADKADAEARIRQALAEAEREGNARLAQVHKEAAEKGKELLREAEERAAEAAVTIAQEAEGESNQLRSKARSRMDEAAKFIVGRVVKS